MQDGNGWGDGDRDGDRQADRQGDRYGPGAPRGGAPEPTRRLDDMDSTQVIGRGGVIGGRYRLESVLGAGGSSEVHRATDLRLNRPVAVKLFGFDADQDSARRFTDEAQTLANLSHPGLVSVFDSGVEGEQPFLVMELVNGWTLHEVISQEQLPLDEISRIGTDLADVLGYVHQQGLVHRDIKPSNVLIGRDNRVRLTDFGIARPIDRDRPALGTTAYLSPEQVRGEWVGPPADVYALGLVLLEAVTGRVEYPGGGREAAQARLERSPEVPADLPEEFREALLAMTDLDPRERPTATQAASMLAHRAPPRTTEIVATEPPARNTTAQIVAIALGALLLAALIGFVAFATNDDETATSATGGSSSATRAPATTTRKTPATTATTEKTTAANTIPKLPTSGISLPEVSLPDVPDINLPDAPDISGSVTDEIEKAWQKFTTWVSNLF